jgi:sigma-E factor negative regulatory protein RseB
VKLRANAVLLVVGVIGVVGTLALTGPSASAFRDPFGGAGDDDHRAVDLLHHAAVAMAATSYSGTRMLSAWGHDRATTVLVDVEHVAGQGTRLAVRGGGVSPDTATFLAAEAGGAGHAAGITVDSLRLLTDAYAVTLGPRDSVAGRASRVVEVSRAGALVARLWVDDRSGLLLRREVFDVAGRLVRESAFIDVHVAPSDFMQHLPPTSPDPAAHDVGVGRRDTLETGGWECPGHAGAMRLVGIEVLGGAGALHMTYSDGLSRMSVFEQHGRLDADTLRGFDRVRFGSELVHVREGMPTYAMWEDDGLVFTAVTDGSLDTVAAAVAHRATTAGDDLGFWDRVAGGMTRLGSWATPLV